MKLRPTQHRSTDEMCQALPTHRWRLYLPEVWCQDAKRCWQAGVPEGPLVGQILNEVEEWWIDADFTDDEFSLAERLKAVVQATAY